MSDIGARLLASLRYDAVNGTTGERAVVTQQMREAAQYIATLTAERNDLRRQRDLLGYNFGKKEPPVAILRNDDGEIIGVAEIVRESDGNTISR